MTKGSEDYSKGKALPSPVTPATTVCFKITIPNAVQYRAALFGVLSQLSNWYTWDHPTDGTTCFDCEEAAQLWAKAISEAYFEEECETVMSCDDIADCIETDTGTQAAIAAIVNTVSLPGTTSTQGVPMTTEAYAAPLNTRPTCELDELWSQCFKFIDYLTKLGIDVFENLEAYSNALEASTFIEMVPILGTMIDEAGIDNFLDFLDWSLEVIQENYEAALTEEVLVEIACALFCAAKDDCVISIERTLQVLNVRLGGVLVPSELVTIDQVMNAMITLGTSTSLPVDTWLAFIMGSAKTASFLGIRGIDKTVQIMLALAAGDPSNAWEALCVDCPPPPVDVCVGGESNDFRIGSQSWVPWLSRAIYHSGEGFGINPAVAGNRISILRTMAPTPTRMKFNFTHEIGQVRLYNSDGVGLGSIAGATTTFVTEADGSKTYTMISIALSTSHALIDCGADGMNAATRYRWHCWNYDI